MKGLIAPLLVTMMTGMVFGQQHQSNNFGSGNGVDAAGGGLLGRYLLVMDQDLVRGLKNQGYLQADIPWQRIAIRSITLFFTRMTTTLKTPV